MLVYLVFHTVAEGQHTLSKTVVSSSKGGLALFATKKATCIGCRALLSHEGGWLEVYIEEVWKAVHYTYVFLMRLCIDFCNSCSFTCSYRNCCLQALQS